MIDVIIPIKYLKNLNMVLLRDDDPEIEKKVCTTQHFCN